jgi:hypothetical protein
MLDSMIPMLDSTQVTRVLLVKSYFFLSPCLRIALLIKKMDLIDKTISYSARTSLIPPEKEHGNLIL